MCVCVCVCPGLTPSQTAKIAAERALAERQAQRAAAAASLPPERRIAMQLVKEMYLSWGPPLEAMTRAGRAFEGLEALLGAQEFNLQVQGGMITVECNTHTHTDPPTHPPTQTHTHIAHTCTSMPACIVRLAAIPCMAQYVRADCIP